MCGPAAFLHLIGQRQSPNHSEYEIEMSGIERILISQNADLINGSILRVIDEKKPVFIVADSIWKQVVWKLDDHLEELGKKNKGMVSTTAVLSSDLGVIISIENPRSTEKTFSIRIDSEEYFIENAFSTSDKANIISINDFIEFVSGEIVWENLKGRSYIFKKSLAKEKSSEEKNAEFAEQIKFLEKKLASVEEKNAEFAKQVKFSEKKLASDSLNLSSSTFLYNLSSKGTLKGILKRVLKRILK